MSAAADRAETGDVEAEKAVVAALLTHPDAYDDVMDVITASDFRHPALRAIFGAIVACEATSRPVDVVTVADELRREGALKAVPDGAKGLKRLAEAAGSVANLDAHVAIVAGHAKLRRIVGAGRAMVADASSPEADANEVVQRAEAAIFELGETHSRAGGKLLAQAVPELLQELADSRGKLLLGHSTGFKDLDAFTAGLQGGQLIALAGRPGSGKSALALQIGRHVAETSGLTTVLLSYEMSVGELTLRLLSSAVGLPGSSIRQGDIPSGADLDLAKAAQKMAALPMIIDDTPPSTIGGVRSALRRLARRTPIGLIIVDYLQLMTGDRARGNRTEEVSDVTRGLKSIAIELNTPLLALSQLSRAVEARPNKRPILSDLRDSGSVEQDANSVYMVFRPSAYDAAADPHHTELIIAKQRSGRAGVTVHLHFDAACTRFRDGSAPPGWDGGTTGARPNGRSASPF